MINQIYNLSPPPLEERRPKSILCSAEQRPDKSQPQRQTAYNPEPVTIFNKCRIENIYKKRKYVQMQRNDQARDRSEIPQTTGL